MSMVKNIRIWDDNPDKSRVSNVVRIEFKYKTDWCILNLEELKKILELWIIGEEMKYPQSKGFEGRWMLFKEIKKVFEEVPVK